MRWVLCLLLVVLGVFCVCFVFGCVVFCAGLVPWCRPLFGHVGLRTGPGSLLTSQ